MTKSGLVGGMVVNLRNGLIYTVKKSELFGDIISQEKSHMTLDRYETDMTHEYDEEYDIIKVLLPHDINKMTAFLLRSDQEVELIKRATKVVWEEEERVVEMTVAQIEKKLGLTKLKIIK